MRTVEIRDLFSSIIKIINSLNSDKKVPEFQLLFQRLTPQAEKLRAEIEVTCYQYEGVDAIKARVIFVHFSYFVSTN